MVKNRQPIIPTNFSAIEITIVVTVTNVVFHII